MANQTSSTDSSFGKDRAPNFEAQGQAALLLLESLIHSLLDNGALTKDQALEAFGSAYEVKEESAQHNKESGATLRASLRLLHDMRLSIEAHDGHYDHASGARAQPGQRGFVKD